MAFRADTTAISDKELIGRRVFGGKVWDGYYSLDGVQIFRWDHFFDERLISRDNQDDGLSFDRLGVKRPDANVRATLRALAISEGQGRKPPRAFEGWAVIEVAKLREIYPKLELVPCPIIQPRAAANPFHALLKLGCYQERERAREIAAMLCFLASVPPYKGLIS